MDLTISFVRVLLQLALLKLWPIDILPDAPLPALSSELELASLDVSNQHSHSNLAQYSRLPCVYRVRFILPRQLLTDPG